MEPNPSICAPSWILIGSFGWISTEASFSSVFKGVYGVTNELGETVVGLAKPAYRRPCQHVAGKLAGQLDS
jgi:hypothetical protein